MAHTTREKRRQARIKGAGIAITLLGAIAGLNAAGTEHWPTILTTSAVLVAYFMLGFSTRLPGKTAFLIRRIPVIIFSLCGSLLVIAGLATWLARSSGPHPLHALHTLLLAPSRDRALASHHHTLSRRQEHAHVLERKAALVIPPPRVPQPHHQPHTPPHLRQQGGGSGRTRPRQQAHEATPLRPQAARRPPRGHQPSRPQAQENRIRREGGRPGVGGHPDEGFLIFATKKPSESLSGG